MNTFIIDNGAYCVKSGYSSDSEPRITPNYITKSKNSRETYIGSDLYDCKDYSGLFYNLAFHKGILVNWDIQRQVWNQLFKKHSVNKVDYTNTNLIVTEPIFNFVHAQECLEELVFEENCFEGLVRINAPTLSAYNYLKTNQNDFCLVVDSGYSFTHVAPFYKGNLVLDGVRRINVGGKHLTNYLKEIISYRQLMVMDETYVINSVKEEACFVSTNFDLDMKIAKLKTRENAIVRDYVLPDYANIRKGYAKSQEQTTGIPESYEQIIRLNNERFQVPELLFHPSDIGIEETGIPEAIFDAVESCPQEIKPFLYANIVLVGGNTLFHGFKERVFNDLRSMIHEDYDLNVFKPENDNNLLTYAWQGGRLMCNNNGADFKELLVTKKMYDEYGHNICKKKFDLNHN